MANITFCAKKVVFNSVTFDNSTGGVISVIVEDNARELETRVGDNLYPTSVEPIDASCTINVELAEFDPTAITAGTKSNLVATIVGPGSTTTDETFYNMKYMGRNMTQGRASSANSRLKFVFESADGVKGPRTA